MPRVSDRELECIAEGGHTGNDSTSNMARELIAARVIVDGRRANCACHKQPCPCMFCEQLRKYDEAIK